MNLQLIVLCVVCLAACAAPSDPWREAAHKPIDTGSHVWWDKVKGNDK